MDTFRIIVAGSRTFDDYNMMRNKIDTFLSHKKRTHNIVIVSGNARGADQMGARYAGERGYNVETYPANWDRYGKRAGYIRNEEMGRIADVCIAFWDGRSRGTSHMINIMVGAGKPCRTVMFNS